MQMAWMDTSIIVKVGIVALLVLMIPIGCVASTGDASIAGFDTPYVSYTYDFWHQPTPAPQAYIPSSIVTGDDIGAGSLNKPEDIYVSNNGDIYIIDTGNNRIVYTDKDWNLLGVISEFTNGDKTDRFNNPNGIFVTDNGNIYVADTGNARVIELDQKGNFIREIGSPTTDGEGLFSENFVYRPMKVGVDESGWVYVISENLFEGFITFDQDGIFRGFNGAPRVQPSPFEYIRARIATEEQRKRLAIFLPTEYSNFDIDDKGFIYATVTSEEGQPVRRLNPKGEDLLKRLGFNDPSGDVVYAEQYEGPASYGPSVMQDIVVQDNGVYSVLDSKRGRVFTYDDNGNLLYLFGYKGDRFGELKKPVSIENMGYSLAVLDQDRNAVVVYKPTRYATLILAAQEFYKQGMYEETEAVWREVLKENANYDIAYIGIGQSLLRRNLYGEAMTYFKLGNDRRDYSEAFRFYRKEVVDQNFGIIMFVIIILLGIAVFVFVRGKRTFKAVTHQTAVTADEFMARPQGFYGDLLATIDWLRYTPYMIFHPINGFQRIKNSKRGAMPAAMIVLLAATLTIVFNRQYSGFIFNYINLNRFNILTQAGTVLFPFILWSVINWALTTLMEGKGTIREIIIGTAFALVPLIIVYIPVTVISNYLLAEEDMFYYMIMSFAGLWSTILLFFGGVMTIHEYDIKKALYTCILTLCGIVFSLFIGLLFFNLAEQVVIFVSEIFAELAYRS